MSRHRLIACHVRDLLLEHGQNLAIDQDDLPHAGPDGQSFVVLGRTLLRNAVVQLLQNIVFKRIETLSRNVPELCLDRDGKTDKLLGWIAAPKGSCFPNTEEAVHLVDFADKVVLWQTATFLSVCHQEALESMLELAAVLALDLSLDPMLKHVVAWYTVSREICQTQATSLFLCFIRTVGLDSDHEG